jgi:hypothetical protein
LLFDVAATISCLASDSSTAVVRNAGLLRLLIAVGGMGMAIAKTVFVPSFCAMPLASARTARQRRRRHGQGREPCVVIELRAAPLVRW